MGTDRSSDLGMVQRAVIQRYPIEARKLPADGEWLREDIGLDPGALAAFSANDAVAKVRADSSKDKRHYWTTADGIVEWVETHTQEPTSPCGHATGIRTIEPGTYTCSCEDCDCRMDRETAESVIA